MDERFGLFVFSFNRGEFLENCLRSIEYAAGALPVHIVDDGSTDPDTRAVLERWSARHTVHHNNRGPGESEHKTGGLAGSMNQAMEIAAQAGFEYAIFIQDDMQFVRRFTADDVARIDAYFAHVRNAIQLTASFVRRLSVDTFLDDRVIDLDACAYLRRKETERGKSNFSATGVFHIERFQRLFGNFVAGEAANSAKAMALGLTSGKAIYPFMNWLPYSIAFRGKKRSLKHRFFEHFGRSGYYPIALMDDARLARLFERDPAVVPIMEDFLDCPTAPRQDVWSTGGGEYNFLAYGSLMARLYSALRRVKAAAIG